MSKPRLLDLFSGVGGFSLGFERAGFETVAFSEIEPFPCRVLAERFAGVPNLGDIREITPEQIEALGQIDVVTFGSPCQDWSVAGKRLGLKGHRSSLFHEAIRIIRLCKPRFAVFENVPGLFSSAGGWDFASVLDEMAESGAVDIAWGVLDAQWFGVPQRRRRVFLVADFAGESAGEILSISEGVCRDSAPSREAGEDSAGRLGSSTEQPSYLIKGAADCRAPENGPQWSELLTDGTTYTVDTKEPHAVLPPSTQTRLAGSARWDAETETFIPEVAPALRSNFYSDHDGDENRLITHALGLHSTQDPVTVEDGTPCLGTGNSKGYGSMAVAFALRGREDGTQLELSGEATSSIRGASGGSSKDYVAQPMSVREDQRTGAIYEMPYFSALNQTGGKPGQGYAAVRQEMAVRRLTPLECERLQGFPDGWTDIPGASDSARYRAMGNAVAVPPVFWIASRMRKEFG